MTLHFFLHFTVMAAFSTSLRVRAHPERDCQMMALPIFAYLYTDQLGNDRAKYL